MDFNRLRRNMTQSKDELSSAGSSPASSAANSPSTSMRLATPSSSPVPAQSGSLSARAAPLERQNSLGGLTTSDRARGQTSLLSKFSKSDRRDSGPIDPNVANSALAGGHSVPQLQSGELIAVRQRDLRFVDLVDESMITGLSQDQRMRQEVIYELILSERQYVDDMTFLVRVLLAEIKAQKLLTQQEIGSLFANVENLLQLNVELRRELDSLLEANPIVGEIGHVLNKYSKNFKIYAVYCSNQPYFIPRLEEFKKKYAPFRTWLESTVGRPEFRGTNLQAFLIKPVQRVTKYPLLLREVLKHTPDYHTDYAPLVTFQEAITNVVDQINERTRKLESYKKIEELEVVLDKAKDLNLKELNRLFVREGACKSQRTSDKKAEEVYLFLFSDLLLITQQKKDKYKLLNHKSLEKLIVSDIPERLLPGALELGGLYEDGTATVFTFETAIEKKNWLDDLVTSKKERTAKVEERAAELAQVAAANQMVQAKTAEEKVSAELELLRAENASLKGRLMESGSEGRRGSFSLPSIHIPQPAPSSGSGISHTSLQNRSELRAQLAELESSLDGEVAAWALLEQQLHAERAMAGIEAPVLHPHPRVTELEAELAKLRRELQDARGTGAKAVSSPRGSTTSISPRGTSAAASVPKMAPVPGGGGSGRSGSPLLTRQPSATTAAPHSPLAGRGSAAGVAPATTTVSPTPGGAGAGRGGMLAKLNRPPAPGSGSGRVAPAPAPVPNP